jgi:hypothetical protein
VIRGHETVMASQRHVLTPIHIALRELDLAKNVMNNVKTNRANSTKKNKMYTLFCHAVRLKLSVLLA